MFLNLLYLIVLTIPWGLHKKFVFPFSYLGDNLNSHLVFKWAPTDILLSSLFFFLLLRLSRNSGAPHRPYLRKYLSVLAFMALITVSTLFSVQKETAFYQTWRLGLYLVFYFCLSRISDLKETFRKIVWLMAGLILLQALLALFQFIKQSFVLGFVPWGEPLFSASQSGAPLVNFFGDLKLRAFGTFTHPNVLGGFLSLVLVWIFDLMTKIQPKRQRIFLGVVFLLGLTALILTFSQASWGSFLIGLVLYGIFRTINPRRKFLAAPIVVLVTVGLGLTLLAIGRLPFDSVNARRQEFLVVSANLISQRPWFGIGLGNFVRFSLPEFPEPVHNLFLLIGAEVGLPALIVFIFLILVHLRQAFWDLSWEKKLLGLSLLQLLFLGLFDHYLWTSHPGQLLFWLVLGLNHSEKNY